MHQQNVSRNQFNSLLDPITTKVFTKPYGLGRCAKRKMSPTVFEPIALPTTPGFYEIRTAIRLPLEVNHLHSIRNGIEAKLSSLLMNYSSEFGGIVLAYWNIRLSEESGLILPTSPSVILLNATATILVFRFEIQSRLIGTVNKIGSDHIGLIVLDAFNVSIKKEQIKDRFTYDQSSKTWKQIDKTEDSEPKKKKQKKNSSSKNEIKDGSYVCFKVARIRYEDGYFCMDGSLYPSDTGISQTPGPVPEHYAENAQ